MKRLACFLVLFTLFSSIISYAQDRVFARTYESTVLPSGVSELEYWATFRGGRSYYYGALDQRLEFEVGLGGDVQTSFYLNIKQEGHGDPNKFSNGIERETVLGFSNEWKWKLSDPVKDAFGFALYAELGAEANAFEIEGKLLFDKKIGNTTLALNLSGEYEVTFEDAVRGEAVQEWEAPFEFDFGLMQLLSDHVGLGLEVVNRNDVTTAGWENSVLFAGPTLHVHGGGWWVNFNILPQITNLKPAEGFSSGLDLQSNERVQVRLIASFAF